MPRRWSFKTEPNEYSYGTLEQEKKTVWDGVKNNLALKHLREVRMGNEILIYHSGDEKAIVGMAEAIKDAAPDPNDSDEKVVVVNIKSKRKLPRPLTLADIKAIEELSDFDLVRLPRLSVMPVSREQWDLLEDAMKS